MTVTLLRGDAAHLPLPDRSVDLVVTSPPYFALRSYQDGGVHYPGQIGSEGTSGGWLDALIGCVREWVRVLKPSGSIWVNLGDKYSTGNGGDQHLTELGQRLGTPGLASAHHPSASVKPDHFWNDPDADGHNCVSCPLGSVWRCDQAAHPTRPAMPKHYRALLEAFSRHRRRTVPPPRGLA